MYLRGLREIDWRLHVGEWQREHRPEGKGQASWPTREVLNEVSELLTSLNTSVVDDIVSFMRWWYTEKRRVLRALPLGCWETFVFPQSKRETERISRGECSRLGVKSQGE